MHAWLLSTLSKYLPFLKYYQPRKMDAETFECVVCWQTQLVELSVACTEFEVPDFDDLDEEILTDSSESDSENEQEQEKESNDNELKEIIGSNVESFRTNLTTNTESKSLHVSHKFCSDCIRGLATNACDDAPLAKGGVGLCCMENGCSGVLLLSSFRCFLSSDLLTRLEDRMQHETIAKAKIKNLERCLRCNSGQIMRNRAYRRRNLKFKCTDCGAGHCRLCKVPWKRAHSGRSCWEYKWYRHYRYGWDQSKLPEFVSDETAQKLTENIIRQCPDCGISFLKSNGCNKMVCRCGQTQCYSCRAVGVTYNHFCNCATRKTKNCCSKCDLFDDVKARERKERDEILRSAKRRHETSIDSPLKHNTPKRSLRSSMSGEKVEKKPSSAN